jgi:hypothetical protein
MAGNDKGAALALERAIALFEQKGNLVGVARVRSLQEQLTLA